MSEDKFQTLISHQEIDEIAKTIKLSDGNNVFSSTHWFEEIQDNNISFLSDKTAKNQLSLNLETRSKFSIKVAELVGEPYIQYNDLIKNGTANKTSIDKFMSNTLAVLKGKKIDALYLHNVRQDAHIFDYCQKFGTIIESKKAPAIDLTGYETYESYLKTTSKKVRYWMRKINRDYECEYTQYTNDEITYEVAAEVVGLKVSQLSARGLTSRVFANPKNVETLIKFLSSSPQDFKCHVSTIKLNGKLASSTVFFSKGKKAYYYLLAMNDEFIRCSPGNAIFLHNLQYVIDNGFDEFDFLAPEDDYKFRWTKGNFVEVFDFVLPLSLKGRLFGSVYLKTIRPKLKKLYLALKS